MRVFARSEACALGENVVEFLRALGGPACIVLEGRVPGPPRLVSTLIHGNEPSGVLAIHRFLRQGIEPLRRLVLTVTSVEAALAEPPFERRASPAGRDQNRCFRPPWEGPEGRRALALRDAVRGLRPEAIVDLHNTSGRGPAYGVSLRVDPEHEALTSRFAERIIHTDLELGTFMEAVRDVAPVVTIECGGARDPRAHEVAFTGLCRFACDDDVLVRAPSDPRPSVLRGPLRVELAAGSTVAFSDTRDPSAAVTLPPDVDLRNFAVVPAGTAIGWLGDRGLDALRVLAADGTRDVAAFFLDDHGRLVAARDLEPLMATTDPEIARSDCLFYLVPC